MAQVASSAKGTIDAELFVVRNDLYYVYVGRGANQTSETTTAALFGSFRITA